MLAAQPLWGGGRLRVGAGEAGEDDGGDEEDREHAERGVGGGEELGLAKRRTRTRFSSQAGNRPNS